MNGLFNTGSAGGRRERKRFPRVVGSPPAARLPQGAGSGNVGRPDLARLGARLLRACDRAGQLAQRCVLEPRRTRPGRAGRQTCGRRRSSSPFPLRRLRSATARALLHLLQGDGRLLRARTRPCHAVSTGESRAIRSPSALRPEPPGVGQRGTARQAVQVTTSAPAAGDLGHRERTIYREAVLAAECRGTDPPPNPFDPSRIDEFARLVDDPSALRSLSPQARARLERFRAAGISFSSLTRVSRRLVAAARYTLTEQSQAGTSTSRAAWRVTRFGLEYVTVAAATGVRRLHCRNGQLPAAGSGGCRVLAAAPSRVSVCGPADRRSGLGV